MEQAVSQNGQTYFTDLFYKCSWLYFLFSYYFVHCTSGKKKISLFLLVINLKKDIEWIGWNIAETIKIIQGKKKKKKKISTVPNFSEGKEIGEQFSIFYLLNQIWHLVACNLGALSTDLFLTRVCSIRSWFCSKPLHFRCIHEEVFFSVLVKSFCSYKLCN